MANFNKSPAADKAQPKADPSIIDIYGVGKSTSVKSGQDNLSPTNQKVTGGKGK